MNDQTPPILPKNPLDVSDTSPESIRTRIAAFCEWFGVEPVKLKVRAGKIYMTDELLAWSREVGICIDWLISGKVRYMAAAYRADFLAKQDLTHLLGQLGADEKRLLLDCIKAYQAGEVTLEEAMARFREGCQQRDTAPLPA